MNFKQSRADEHTTLLGINRQSQAQVSSETRQFREKSINPIQVKTQAGGTIPGGWIFLKEDGYLFPNCSFLDQLNFNSRRKEKDPIKQVKDGFSFRKLITLLLGAENWSLCCWPVKSGEYFYFAEVCR